MNNLKKYEVNTRYNLKIIWSYLMKYKWLVVALFFVVVSIELIAFFDNFLFKFLIDKATAFSDGLVSQNEFFEFLVLMIGIFFLLRGIGNGALWFLNIRLFNHLEGRFMNQLEKDSFWHILNLSYRYHINKKTGSIISQFTRGVSKIESMLDAIYFNFFPVIIRIILSVSVIIYFDVATALALLIMVVLFVSYGIWLTNKQKTPQNEANYQEDILKQNLSDVFKY